MSYKRFDRHEIFQEDDHVTVMKAISESRGSFNTNNMLFGLFDGYLYDDLLPACKKELQFEDYMNLQTLVNVIELAIEEEGEKVTQV